MHELVLGIATLVTIWIVIGIWMVIQTDSRGWKADVAFVLLWPLHWYFEVWRRHR